ncbi:hypothetical protein BOX37_31015 [Nocardia mangyaensis]|uniref:Uncharacterized protein n=1 Tax=Nocardia mangyaensis TaxID=2213200 RepID=A0A1J0W047_9NOCA|nr:hypothetical protein BOX37_31015 [Nocardia mangyaensis]
MRGRRILFAVSGLLLAALVVTVALWPVYVRPRTDPPQPADAILILGGAHDGREELGLSLAAEGYAPRVLVSNPYERSPMVNRICHGGYSFEVICFDPSPRTTLGEGRGLARLGADWHRVIVVTFTPHISRARYILGTCWPGELLFVDPQPHLSPARWAWDYAYQSAGYVKAWFANC